MVSLNPQFITVNSQKVGEKMEIMLQNLFNSKWLATQCDDAKQQKKQ